MIKITILYDNRKKKGVFKNIKIAHGFSCNIQIDKKNIIFDTGWDGDILLYNMDLLNIDIKNVDMIILSHRHGDHSGGLARLLNIKSDVKVFVPLCFYESLKKRIGNDHFFNIKNLLPIKKSAKLISQLYTTGELTGNVIRNNRKILVKEQSLILNSEKGIVVITGCAHPGIGNIIKIASKYGRIYAIIGGFHDFNNYKILEKVPLIVPLHCTKNKKSIEKLFPNQCIKNSGVGEVISI